MLCRLIVLVSAARSARSIPRISRDHQHTAASGGIWLHGLDGEMNNPRPRN